jgi:hypothetical protein
MKFLKATLVFNPADNEWALHIRKGKSCFAQTRTDVIDAAIKGLPQGFTLRLL